MAGEWQWQGREGGRRWTWMRVLLLLACLVPLAHAFEDAISEREGERRQCAGMYAKSLATGQVDPYIEILFAESAVGQIALAIFPYSLVDLMGSPLSEPLIGRRYICDETAIQDKLCLEAEAGTFIVHRELPGSEKITSQVIKFPSMAPLQYRINSTDYYCVVTSPFVLDSNLAQKTTYDGVIEWHSASGGWLPASEYPKMPFYGALGVVYILLGLGWASQCWLHRRELLQIQWFVLGLFGLLSLEMVADWAYLFHLDKTGPGVLSNVLLGIAAILNAGRTSLSFFSLLVVSLGLGVVKPSLGKVMTRCQVLGVMHFLFGVLYSVGLVTVDVTSSAAFWLLLVICPLSVTMTVFLTWTLAGLNSTIAFLTSKKQMVKVTMYKRLYRILLLAVLVIGAFFVINGMIFSRRLDESFAPENWKIRWLLLDAWMNLLYLMVFLAIAFLWRPTGDNRRFAMSQEISQNEDFEVEDFNPDELHDHEESGGGVGGGEGRTGGNGVHSGDDYHTSRPPSYTPKRSGVRGYLGGKKEDEQELVFDIGSEGEEEEEQGGGR